MSHQPQKLSASAFSSSITSSPFSASRLKRALQQASLAAAITVPLLQPVWAAEALADASLSQHHYQVSAGPLEAALTEFAKQAGILLSFEPELVAGKRSAGLSGSHSVNQGFEKLLKGSGLDVVVNSNGNFGLKKLPESALHGGSLPEVKVAAQRQTASIDTLMPSYSGGQVATGGRVGLLGNRDFMDTPFNITAYTSSMIQNRQAATIADVIDNDPSVRNGNPRGGRFDQFSIRGVTFMNSDVAFNGLFGILPTYAVAAESAERVEVLKGASGMLNGMVPSGGGAGGMINIVPKRAGDKDITQFTVSHASESQFGGHMDAGRRFGPDKAFGIRFNGVYQDPGELAFDHQSRESALGALALDFRGEALRLSLDVGHQKRNINAPPERVTLANTAGVLAQVPDAKRIDNNYEPSWTYTNTQDNYSAARGEYDLNSQWTVFAAAGARQGEYEFLRVNPVVLSNGNFSNVRGRLFSRYERVRSLEVGVRANLETGPVKHALTLTGNRYRMEYGNLDHRLGLVNSNIYAPAQVLSPNLNGLADDISKTNTSDLGSIALVDNLTMLDGKLQLVLGARSQHVNSHNFEDVTRYNEKTLTPLAAFLIRPNRQVSVFGSYIESLRQGDVIPTGTGCNGLECANAGGLLAPVKSKQLEIGTKLDFGSFATSISLFQLEQPTAYAVGQVFGINGKQRNRGLELNVFGEPWTHHRVLGGLMLLDTEMVKSAGGINDGNRIFGTSRANFNLNWEWDTPMEGLTLTARSIYSSSQYYDAANTRKIPAWTRFDIGARYATTAHGQPLTLRASVENLFDRQYWSSTAAASGSMGLSIGTPRMLLMSATVDF